MSYRGLDSAHRVAAVRKCFSSCERAPSNPRVPRSSRHWQPAYNHCITGCSQSGGVYSPYQLPPPRRVISEDCVRQAQYEAMGSLPEDIIRMTGKYDPSCNGAWQYSKYAGRRRSRGRKSPSTRSKGLLLALKKLRESYRN